MRKLLLLFAFLGIATALFVRKRLDEKKVLQSSSSRDEGTTISYYLCFFLFFFFNICYIFSLSATFWPYRAHTKHNQKLTCLCLK
ncbi:hypothetical protein O6H91_03G012200 [Diphasiastrum complanatum]|uniref:Uncharacterized protein n=1 Tax=Diphasiastrum complanatum TaxID=34168 RepID=A0ACC2E3D0_DIPCM|nr:hypothetical protein O6H91_03G012200 [Diphasiastrum complanatum]